VLYRVVKNNYDNGVNAGENSESLLCRLEDGVVLNTSLRIIIFLGDTLLRRVYKIIDLVVEEFLYKIWISITMNEHKLFSRKVTLVHPLG
jgi:hypothetical protein